PTLPPKAPGVCKSSLGMQSKGIPNANISASSTLSTNHVPAFARLDERRGAWCSAPNDNSPYVEILLDEEKLITKVVTQGSYKDLLWATKYQIKYLKEGKWSSYQKADGSLKLEGNTNVRALKEHDLQPPIRTHSIRIYPMAPLSVMPNEYNVVCLRLELFGCSVKTCGDPGTPINGEQAHVKIGYIYSGSVEFTCKDNYTLSGASEIYCEETKNWSSPLPQCCAPCPDPGVPSNGRRTGDDFRHGKSVTFKCQDEFELKGVATINCNDGTWTDDIPQCKDPPKARLVSPVSKVVEARVGSSTSFTCNASGLTLPSIRWMRQSGSSVNEIVANNVKYQVDSSPGSSQLIIKNISDDDQGYYICNASSFESHLERVFLGVICKFLLHF
ncbi:hypothetical protein ACROYT_G029280, partial [Oculina patagonica]